MQQFYLIILIAEEGYFLTIKKKTVTINFPAGNPLFDAESSMDFVKHVNPPRFWLNVSNSDTQILATLALSGSFIFYHSSADHEFNR